MHRVVSAIFILLLGCFLLAPAQAQPHGSPQQQGTLRISGVVVDADTSAPLPGVRVQAAGASAATNNRGRFTLTLPKSGQLRLQFSHAGYRSVTKTIDSATSAVIVSMKRDG